VLHKPVRYDAHVGLLSNILGRAADRYRGFLAKGEDDEKRRLARPTPTPTTRPPQRPTATPTTRRMGDPGTTAGTRSYRGQGGTPSTQQLHNPRHFGR
jgi:hypothetical protein